MNVLVKAGHSEYDILWRYSISKVDRYFDDAITQQMRERHHLAVTVGNALACHMEAATKASASRQANEWKKFLSYLDPDAIKQKAKDRRNPLKALAMAGLPIFMPVSKKDDEEGDN